MVVARVYVDVGVACLDRPFDYEIPEDMVDQVTPGIRVKVRFNGRLLSGFVTEAVTETDQERLLPLSRVVSSEVVLPAESVALIRAVADHCAGTFMDVARLAIPPRHAAVEKRPWSEHDPVNLGDAVPSCLDSYPTGSGLRHAVRSGRTPRAAWTLLPVAGPLGDWVDGVTSLVLDAVRSGRGALVLVPDAKDCARAYAALKAALGVHTVVSLSSDQGPQARYSAFLAAVRGHARVVVGTRAAAYVPVKDLGLIVVWDEADSSFEERHSPYPSLRDIVAVRVRQEATDVVFASYSRSTHIQAWVDKGWLGEIGLPSRRASLVPQVRIASQDERSLDRDSAARSSRLPHDAFTVIRNGLELGPVLVWVPWLGDRRNLLCARCGEPMRCACGGRFEAVRRQLSCSICGHTTEQWTCQCGSDRWRATTVGSARTTDELAQAFRTIDVYRSDSHTPMERLDADRAIVIATPGCEPLVDGGYAAAVILDAKGFLARPDLRAGEEAVRRWMHVMSLVRGGSMGGTVLIVGPTTDRAVQAVLRVDAAGFARRELQDRAEARFPPTTRMASFLGEPAAIQAVTTRLVAPGFVELLGPVDDTESGGQRLLARVDAKHGNEFAALIADIAAARSTSKTATFTWRLDPDWLGG
jgi:primosomal protein N' (replication factor Y)